jgi:starch synthase
MRIVQVTAEFSPLAKAGGLGEMVLGLSRELILLGQQVEIILPKYGFLDLSQLQHLRMEVADFKVPIYENLYANAMWSAIYEECPLHFLEAKHPAGYLQKEKIYGYPDDTEKFLYFSLAILHYLKLQNKPIDVLHLHDWHFALVAILARRVFHLPIQAILLTIHSSEYQGRCATWDFDAIGLSGVDYLKVLQDDNPDLAQTLNLLKGGIIYADAVTTVSPSYKEESMSKKLGFHIDATLRKNKGKFSAVLNGIDQKFWNPAKDPHLKVHYDRNTSLEKILQAKEAHKREIETKFGVQGNSPWIGAITRLVPQKGPELIEKAIEETVRLGGTFILLGSSPIKEMQEHFEKLKVYYADRSQVLLYLEYNEGLAHQLYAALDYLIVPSHFEPCGLTQLIAMRYGTIPIAHATGGLKDTLFDCDDFRTPIQQRNGFLFSEAKEEAMTKCLERAFEVFHKEKLLFQSLIRHGMQVNSSWKIPAQEYLRLYRKLQKDETEPQGAYIKQKPSVKRGII